MKFLQDEQLAKITAELTDAPMGSGDRVIHGRIEAFIMKRAGNDKRYAHQLGEQLEQEIKMADFELATLQRTWTAQRRGSEKRAITATSRMKKQTKKRRPPPSSPPPLSTATTTAAESTTTAAAAAAAAAATATATATAAAVAEAVGATVAIAATTTATDPITAAALTATTAALTTTTVLTAPAALPSILKKSRSASHVHLPKATGKDIRRHGGASWEDDENEESKNELIEVSKYSKTMQTEFALSATTALSTTVASVSSLSKPRARSASFDTSKPRSAPSWTHPSPSIMHSSHVSYPFPSPLGDLHQSCNRRLMTDLILTLNASFPDYDFSTVRPSSFVHDSNIAGVIQHVNDKLSDFVSTNTTSTTSSSTDMHHTTTTPTPPYLSLYYPPRPWFMVGSYPSTSTSSTSSSDFLIRFWNAIDQVIQLQECEVYSYSPPRIQDVEEDPMEFLTQSLCSSSNYDDSGGLLPLWTMNYFFVNKIRKRIVFFTCVSSMRTTTTTTHSRSVEEEERRMMIMPPSPGPFVVEPDDEDDDDDQEEDEEEERVFVPSHPSFDEEGDMDEEDDEEGGDYDMDDCMIQAVSAPTL